MTNEDSLLYRATLVKFFIGDIVGVTQQPPYLKQNIVGKVGFIDDMTLTHASFTELALDGSWVAWHTAPTNFLKAVDDPQWVQAKKLFHERLAREKGRRRAESINARMAELSAEYGVPVERLLNLSAELLHLAHRDYYPHSNSPKPL